MSAAPSSEAGPYVSAQLYAEVQQFYARQMNLIEGADADPDAWAETFTEDAVFASPGPQPMEVGREAIRASVQGTVDSFAAQRLDFRHWFGMIDVTEGPDGDLRTRYYALGWATPAGGALSARGSLVCHDHLVRGEDGGWRVRERRLSADGRRD